MTTKHFRCILVLAVLIASAGCSEGGGDVKTGAAFVPPAHVMVRITTPVPVGEQTGVLIADLKNVSGSPVKVTSVKLLGSGIGDVVTVKSNQIAPFGAPLQTTSAGIFRTSPIFYTERGARYQQMLPIGMSFIVKDGVKPRALSADERQCMADTEPLPG
jgi:hypothetical protein